VYENPVSIPWSTDNGYAELPRHRSADPAVINVDHIKNRRDWQYFALELSNTQPLCHLCNKGKSNWDGTDWR
jgi:hypothetical protein